MRYIVEVVLPVEQGLKQRNIPYNIRHNYIVEVVLPVKQGLKPGFDELNVLDLFC